MSNATATPMAGENLIDEELRQVLGERYQGEMQKPPVTEYEELTGSGNPWEKLKAFAGLILGNGLLVYMIMSGKIDLMFGVLFVAGVSAVSGYHIK